MILQLHLEALRGPVGRAPSLRLALWLLWNGDKPWRLTVLERLADFSLGTREVDVPRGAAEALYGAIQRTGLGQRPVRVAERVDTSDSAGQVRVRALLSTAPERWAEAVVPTLSSGFEGEDAESLRDFFRLLLNTASVATGDTRWSLLGEPG